MYTLTSDIQRRIIEDARFPGSAPRMVWTLDGGGSGFYPHFVGLPLLRRALRHSSPEEALDWLSQVLATTQATGKTIDALWGVSVDGEIQLTPSVKILRFEQTPECPQKQWITGNRFDLFSIGHILKLMPPSSALVMERCIKNPIRENKETGEGITEEINEAHKLLGDISLILTAIGPRAVISAGRWSVFDDPNLQEALIGYSKMGGSPEILPSRPLDYPVLDSVEAKRLVPSYLALTGEAKNKVRVALQRLNQAQLRHGLGDQAVELATAFETLLGDGNTEMTHKIRVRSARMIGGSGQQWKKNSDIVNSMYSLRSKMIHTGSVDIGGKERIAGELISRSDVTSAAIGICAAIIRIVIDRGTIPDWSIFDITEHA